MNYLLYFQTVGTDRNISDSVLEHRAELLSSFVKLYHRDLETVYEQCIANNGSYKTVADKFYHMFETYLPILQYNGSIFQNVSTLKIPPVRNLKLKLLFLLYLLYN